MERLVRAMPVSSKRGDLMFCLISSAFQSRVVKLKDDEDSSDRKIIRLSTRGSIEDVEFYADEIRVLIDNSDLSLWKTPTLCTKAFTRLDAAYEYRLSLCDTAVDRLGWARNQGDSARFLWRYFVKLVKRSKHSHNNAVDKLKKAFQSVHGHLDDSDSDDLPPADGAEPSKVVGKKDDLNVEDDEEDEEDMEDDQDVEELEDDPHVEEDALMDALTGYHLHRDEPLNALCDRVPESASSVGPVPDFGCVISDSEEDVEARCHLTPGPPQATAVIARARSVSEQATASTHGHHRRVMGTDKKRRRLSKKQPGPQKKDEDPQKTEDPQKAQKAEAQKAEDPRKNSCLAKNWTMELAQQVARLAGVQMKVADGIEVLCRMDSPNVPQLAEIFRENILKQIHFDPEQLFAGLAINMKYMNQRKKVIWQIKTAKNRAICQVQTREDPGPEDVENTFLRAKILMWFATAGADKKILKKVKALVDERGIFGD